MRYVSKLVKKVLIMSYSSSNPENKSKNVYRNTMPSSLILDLPKMVPRGKRHMYQQELWEHMVMLLPSM